jgi:UDP-N-acetylglucosamine acyltransferase
MLDTKGMIHPTAMVSPQAQIDASVQIGPYAVIDEHVALGPGCRVGPHVYMTGHASVGANNRFHAGCVMGDAPQDLKYKDEPTRLVIGDANVFREGCTVHRSNKLDEATTIGSHNFLMANSHVGHNSVIGDHVILANGALLGGHVQVGDRVFISGNCVVHQFVRVGTLALMQGTAALSSDLPPFTMARCGGINQMCGLNMVGLRRAGMGPTARLELKRLYHLLFRSGKNLSAALAEARRQFTSPTAATLLDFIASSKRGVCRQRVQTDKEDDGAID